MFSPYMAIIIVAHGHSVMTVTRVCYHLLFLNWECAWKQKLMVFFRTLTLPFLLCLILCCCSLQYHQFFSIRVWILFCIDNSPMFIISRSCLLPPVFVLYCPWLAQLVAYLPTLRLPYSCSAYPAWLMSLAITSEHFVEMKVWLVFFVQLKEKCFVKQ